MKQKTYQLTIDSPCSQKLSEMTPTGHSKHFCSQCAKNVVDMRERSREEVYKAYKNAKGGLCAVLDYEQIDTPFEVIRDKPLLSLVKHLIMSIIFFFITERSFAQKTKKTENYYIEGQENDAKGSTNNILEHTIENADTLYIKGKVVDSTNTESVPFATITLIELIDRAIQTDIKGNFEIALSKEEAYKLSTIEVRFLGFEHKKLNVRKEDFQPQEGRMVLNLKNIILNKDEDMLILGSMTLICSPASRRMKTGEVLMKEPLSKRKLRRPRMKK